MVVAQPAMRTLLLCLAPALLDGRSFQLPEVAGGKHWTCLIDTHRLPFGETLELQR